MGTGYKNDISVLLPYSNGGQMFQLSNGVLATTGVAVPNCKLVCVDKNNVKWVASDYPYSLFKVVDNVVTTVATWASMDRGIGGLCIDKNNTVWVVDGGAWCAYPFVNGVKGTAVGTGGLGNFNVPSGICSDKDGALWVIKRDPAGINQVTKIVNKVVTANYTVEYGPRAICCDRNNDIYVVNFESASLSKISGGVVTKIVVTAFPSEICVDKNNALWVLHVDNDTAVTKLSKIVNGVTTKVISSGFANSSRGICCDDDNVIWVGDSQGGTLKKIVNDSITETIKVNANMIYIDGDATGMQAAVLFEGGAEIPTILMNQAMSGGM
jgi:hypothetical protein